MTVKAINKSNYTLHYIVFNKKYIKKVILKLEVVQYYKKTFFFFFFLNWLPIKISWQMGEFQCSVGILENTAAKHPIPLKVAVWNF